MTPSSRASVNPTPPATTDPRDVSGGVPGPDAPGAPHGWSGARVRFGSLRLRLVAVFAAVALTAALSVSGISYWLNRDAVLTRAQNSALDDFRGSMQRNAGTLPADPSCGELRQAALRMAQGTQDYLVLLESGSCVAAPAGGTFAAADIPRTLRDAVQRARPLTDGNTAAYHLYWQRATLGGHPYLVGGARLGAGGPTGYLLKSLDAERSDLDSLAWSLGIATLLALIGAALLAQAAASTVLRPVRRLGDAARRLGEGHLDTRLRITGTDELAELSATFNNAAEALQRRVEELSGREAASRRFVADMSHELRTPLTAITAVAEVLEDEADSLDPMIEPAVRLVVTETRRLSDLVENLMEVTRFDAGTAKLRADEVDVADMVTACMDARAWLDSVELDAPRGILVRLDPRRLDVVLANLIGNALKHGGSPVRVTVRREAAAEAGEPDGPGTAEELVIRVDDNGPGIPEDVLPHVFDRFYKADASRARSPGSGLGLSIAMENARIHNGSITAANRSGGGTRFTLRLPIPPDPEPAGAAAEGADGPGGRDGGRA